jgi:putative nucleotidyltransferase with HDIG domain
MTATVYMTVGLPASGKSTWTLENAEKLNATILSSDKIREEWYGDESTQGDPQKIFDYIYKTAKELLTEGKNVIIDATNISQKRRLQFVKDFDEFNKVALYFNTDFFTCIRRDLERDRTVGHQVIKRMYDNLQVPTYVEGWNDIKYFYNTEETQKDNVYDMERFLMADYTDHEALFLTFSCLFQEFKEAWNMPQDNPYHTFSVSRHIYYVYDYIRQNYPKDNKDDYLTMLWCGVLHDIGKAYTKTFENHKRQIKRHASFYNHENVSAQIAVKILHMYGYDDKWIMKIAELVQQHMKLLNSTEKSEKKLFDLVGEDMFKKLKFFREADTSAK